MKLHDLSVGQRFSFIGKHRGKVFEVTEKPTTARISYQDVATGEIRHTNATRKTFRMEVELVTENKVVELTPNDTHNLSAILQDYHKIRCEEGAPNEVMSAINALHIKLTESAGRRVVLPEGE